MANISTTFGSKWCPNPGQEYLQSCLPSTDCILHMICFCFYSVYCYVLCIFAIYECCKHAEIWILLPSLLLVEASRICLQIFSIFVDSCNLKDSFDNARKNISPMHMNLGQKKGDKFPKIWMDRAVHYERVYKAEVRLSTVQ